MAVSELLDLSDELRRCIDNCTECHAICERTAIHCMGMGGEHAGKEHQTALRDCTQICATSADFMTRESRLHAYTCFACAEACRRCAEECERMAEGDAKMIRCAEVCRRCEASCSKMSEEVRKGACAA